MSDAIQDTLERAAAVIRQAEGLLIGAGAGMGVDSGLPDFRGDAGFWKAYPALFGRPFVEMANPRWFQDDPAVAWGFYGHRLNMYRRTIPHAGFAIFRRWADRMPAGHFVFTSNVDGHFQKAGFSAKRIMECHGSIHHLQCSKPCGSVVWTTDDVTLNIDAATLRAAEPWPMCPRCGSVARPNVLMFGDWGWLSGPTAEQEQRYLEWWKAARGRFIVAIELGAGTAIPSVRYECEDRGTRLIRINPREAQVPEGGIGIELGAGEALGRLGGMV